MVTRIIFSIALLCCFPGWSVAGPVHGAHGILYGEYQLHAATDPAAAEAGAPVRLALTLTDPNGAEVTELEPGAATEVAIVRQGLDVFTLLNPAMGDGGVFTLDLNFPVPGTYFIYTGFTPLSGSPLTAMTELRIEGEAPAPLPLEVHVPGRVVSDTLGADIALDKTQTGHRISLGLIEPDGSPMTDLDTASGDLVILSADGTEYFHAIPAPADNATAAAFETTFPRPGTYKAWALFHKAGNTLELPFALDIQD